MTDSKRAGEAGNIVLAMVVLMVIGTLATALLLRAQSDLETTAASGRSERAAVAAERGVADALALIDAGRRGDFGGGADLDGGRYDFTVVQDAADRFTVRSTATLGGRTRTVEATIGGEVASIDDAVVIARVGIASDDNQGSISAPVATPGTISASGLSPGTAQYLLGPDATCTGCSDELRIAEAPTLAEPEPPTGTTLPCPSDWSAPILDGWAGTPIVCDDPANPIVFGPTFEITNGPLVLWVGEGVAVDASGSDLNPSGPVDDLRIVVASDRSGPAPILLEGATIRGAVEAPGRVVEVDRLRLTGRLTVAVLSILDTGTVTIDPATSVEPDFEWRITAWATVASD